MRIRTKPYTFWVTYGPHRTLSLALRQSSYPSVPVSGWVCESGLAMRFDCVPPICICRHFGGKRAVAACARIFRGRGLRTGVPQKYGTVLQKEVGRPAEGLIQGYWWGKCPTCPTRLYASVICFTKSSSAYRNMNRACTLLDHNPDSTCPFSAENELRMASTLAWLFAVMK